MRTIDPSGKKVQFKERIFLAKNLQSGIAIAIFVNNLKSQIQYEKYIPYYPKHNLCFWFMAVVAFFHIRYFV